MFSVLVPWVVTKYEFSAIYFLTYSSISVTHCANFTHVVNLHEAYMKYILHLKYLT